MKKFILVAFASSLLALGAISVASDAGAKVSYESQYGFDRTWNAATRLVRVDLGMKITEKDEGSGYLLFEYSSTESGKKKSFGSMEFVRDKDQRVRVSVQLPAMPHYHEQVLLDQLTKKLRAEYGEPPKGGGGGTSPAKPDGGAEGGTFSQWDDNP